MAETQYDLVVLGAGPGGYVCAIRGAQLGLKTALVEKRPTLGGVCLNVGCIPSKALLHATEIYHAVKEHGSDLGIAVEGIHPDLKALMRNKEETVKKLVGGVAQLCKARKIEVIQGTGKLLSASELEVEQDGKSKTLSARNIVLATGSIPAQLPNLPMDGKTVVGSDEAIAFTSIPKRMAVVGAGAIGLELGSVWSRLGTEVTFLEFLPHVAPFLDEDISKLVERILKKQGMSFVLKAKVTGIKKKNKEHVLNYEKDGKEHTLPTDVVLVAVGRKPATDNLGLQEAGVAVDDKGRVEVDSQLRTKAKGVWAIGDIIAGPMLAHKAEEEGVSVAERIAGRAGHVSYDNIPNVIYTHPEIATVGLTERLAKEQNIAYKVGKFPLSANGRALASGSTEGVVKILAEEKTDRLLGAQIVTPNASELIASVVAHREYGGSAEDLGRTVHAHPTLSEAIKEAALAVHGNAIHSL